MGDDGEASQLSVLFAIQALDRGGPDRVLFELLRRMDRRRFSLSVAVSSGSGHYLSRLPEDVSVHVLPSERNLYTRYPIFHLARLVRRLRPDIVFATSRMTVTAGLAQISFPHHTALIMRVANHVSAKFSELRRQAPIKHRLSFGLQMAVLSRASHIVCQSNDMAEDLSRLGLKVPITVIGNPIDIQEMGKQASPSNTLPGSPALLSAGRLMPQKGFDILLDAFAALRHRYPGAVLSIAGDGPERARLEARCQCLGLCDTVRFLGFVKMLYPLMASADLFVLASRYEGFPNVVLEALACGTPVVATDCPGGTRDMVCAGLTGWLAKAEDPEAFASALLKALEDRHSLSKQRIKQFVNDRFGASHIVAAYEEALFATKHSGNGKAF